MSAASKGRSDARFRDFLSSIVDQRIPATELEPYVSPAADREMVEYLEEVLDQARAGRIRGAILVLQNRGSRSGDFGIVGDLSRDLGSALMNASRLQHLVQLELDSRRAQRGRGL